MTYYCRATMDGQPGVCCLTVDVDPPVRRWARKRPAWNGWFHSAAEFRPGDTPSLRLVACEGDHRVIVKSSRTTPGGTRPFRCTFDGVSEPPAMEAPACYAQHR